MVQMNEKCTTFSRKNKPYESGRRTSQCQSRSRWGWRILIPMRIVMMAILRIVIMVCLMRMLRIWVGIMPLVIVRMFRILRMGVFLGMLLRIVMRRWRM